MELSRFANFEKNFQIKKPTKKAAMTNENSISAWFCN